MSTGGGGRADRRVTLDDVARHAEVSRALVSLVLRDKPGASEATRERVLASVRELGYRPDARARALAGQRSRLIGVMFGVGVGTFHFDLLEGLYSAADARGYGLLLTPVSRGRDERRAAESLEDFRFDGLIMLGPPTPAPLLAGTVPVVTVGWGSEDPRVDSVRTSDAEGMRLAVGHLTALGHRRIAHVDGGTTTISGARRTAYEQAMQAAGLDGEVTVLPGGQSQADGLQAARRLLGLARLPTAVVTYNDDLALGALGWLAQEGLAVPRDVSVLGWDDSEVAASSPVGLTSVRQRPQEMAARAIERVVDRVESRRVVDREVVLTPDLTVRRSTGPVAAPQPL